jgi:hypothetical protein
MQMLHADDQWIVSGERNVTRDQLVQQDPQGIDIRCRPRLLALEAFGSHIRGRPTEDASGRERAEGLTAGSQAMLKQLGNAKIGEVDFCLLIE